MACIEENGGPEADARRKENGGLEADARRKENGGPEADARCKENGGPEAAVPRAKAISLAAPRGRDWRDPNWSGST